jgi:heme exporter protein D
MMPDHWGYVFAAYCLTAAAVLGYWRHLVRRRRALDARLRRGKVIVPGKAAIR